MPALQTATSVNGSGDGDERRRRNTFSSADNTGIVSTGMGATIAAAATPAIALTSVAETRELNPLSFVVSRSCRKLHAKLAFRNDARITD